MKERISSEIIFNNFSENGQELRVWSLPRFNQRLHATTCCCTHDWADDRDSQAPPLGGFSGCSLVIISLDGINQNDLLQPAIHYSIPFEWTYL